MSSCPNCGYEIDGEEEERLCVECGLPVEDGDYEFCEDCRNHIDNVGL